MLRQCESSVRSAVPQRTPSERATHALGVKAVDGEDEGGESRKRGNHGKAETRGMGKTPPWRSRAGSPQAIAHPQFRCRALGRESPRATAPDSRKIVSLKNCHPEPCCPFSEGFPMNAGKLSQFAAQRHRAPPARAAQRERTRRASANSIWPKGKQPRVPRRWLWANMVRQVLQE